MDKKYWYCIIGDVEQKDIPNGGDYPLRQSVKDTFEKMFSTDEYRCYSGWGMDEELFDLFTKLQNIKSLHPNDYKMLHDLITKLKL